MDKHRDALAALNSDLFRLLAHPVFVRQPPMSLIPVTIPHRFLLGSGEPRCKTHLTEITWPGA
jgi:hypothetical protein